jgi:hypothetical protein
MTNIVTTSIIDTLQISAIVFLMMVLVDFFDVYSQGKLKTVVSKTRTSQYFSASFLGSLPGCIGSYINVSMYMHGFLGIGAIASGMIATSGDEAFVMLIQFPEKALLLFGLLFLLAIPLGALLDFILKKMKIESSDNCLMHSIHKQDKEHNYKHYFTVHIWRHIFKKHVVKIIFWTFASLLAINLLLYYWPVENIVKDHIPFVIIIAALIGLIPESGPHLIFVSLYASGLIPFSVLLASSVSQDGHGVLPMLSFSIRDIVIIKIYKLFLAVVIGAVTYYLGF